MLSILGRIHIQPFERGQFKSLAHQLELFDAQPRSWYKGVIITTVPGAKHISLLQVGARGEMSNYLDVKDRIDQNPRGHGSKGKRGESCTSACQRQVLKCDEMQIEFLNSCWTMMELFGCEQCNHMIGANLSAYVEESSDRNYKQCLITDNGTPTCNGLHAGTLRACPCK